MPTTQNSTPANLCCHADGMAEHYESIDAYISTFPKSVREILQSMRSAIAAALPSATEAISYNIPTFRINGKNVIHFAGWKHHVSVYPVPEGDSELLAKLTAFENGKGTLKFPLNEPVPYDLVAAVALQLAANLNDRQPQ